MLAVPLLVVLGVMEFGSPAYSVISGPCTLLDSYLTLTTRQPPSRTDLLLSWASVLLQGVSMSRHSNPVMKTIGKVGLAVAWCFGVWCFELLC